MPAQKEIKKAISSVCTPEIKTTSTKTLVTYHLKSFFDLGQSVTQVTELLHKLAPRSEYIRVKQETVIKAEISPQSENGIKLHFIIPK
jgi:hypothetical protein